MESNLSAHLTPEMWGTVMKAIEATTGGDPAKMEAPKTLQEGCATSLAAALDPSIASMFDYQPYLLTPPPRFIFLESNMY